MYAILVYRKKMLAWREWWAANVGGLGGGTRKVPQANVKALEGLVEQLRGAAEARIRSEPDLAERTRSSLLLMMEPEPREGRGYISGLLTAVDIAGMTSYQCQLIGEPEAMLMGYTLGARHHDFGGGIYEFEANCWVSEGTLAQLLTRKEEKRMFEEELPRYRGAARRALEGLWKASMASEGSGDEELGVALVGV